MAQTPSIQFAEPVNLALKSNSAQFDAYGRRFSLTLIDNERVLNKLPAQRKQQLAKYRLLRGSLDGQPGSWVRLTETPTGVEGAIWDGHDFYAVTSYERIAPILTTPIDAVPGQTVVYRLSDAHDILPRDFCALSNDTPDAKATALDQYQAIVQELQAGVVTPQISKQIEISLIADTSFQTAESPDPTAAMLARLNIVEGIFSEQVGLLILATDVRLMAADSDPFTSTKGVALLEQLGAYRAATPAVRARGLAHLMTGKDLEGTTAGIAYVRTVCDVERGVSISERSFGTTISALIMAHELGHNFGAEHDGEDGTFCEDTGGGFIMAPSVSGFATFSQCSIETMQPVIAAAACVVPAQFADVAVETGVTQVSGEGGLPFSLPFLVRSAGNVTADDAVLTVTLPTSASLSIDSAVSSQGSCSVAGTVATCAFGSLAEGEERQVTVIARSSAALNFTVQARVSASNDRVTSNNNRQMSVSVRSGVDASVVLSTSAAEVAVGSALEVYADVSSRRAQVVRGATLTLSLNQNVVAAAMPGATCTANAFSVSCTLADIPPGTTRRLTVQTNATTAGPLFASANVSAAGDGDFSNNTANASAWVQAERDVALSAGASTVDLGVGTVYEVPYTIRSRGPLPTGDVALTISIASSALAVDSIDAESATCTQPDAITYRCELGPLAAGATRVVRLRVHGTRAVNSDINASITATDDGYPANNFASLQLRIDHLIDVSIPMASGGSGVEDSVIEGQVSLRSNGRQAAAGATLDIDLHSAGTLRAASIHNGAACTLLNPARARCTLPNMPRNSQLFVDYSAEFSEPGNYDVTFTATAPGDTAPDNDSLTRAVLVRPYNDIAVAGSLDFGQLFAGQLREKTFTVTTDRRALATARFVANHVLPGLRVEAIRATSGICSVDVDMGGACDFTDLPANAGVTVTVSYRAGDGAFEDDVSVSVSTAGDVVNANNTVKAPFETLASTDLELRVDAAMGGARSTTLNFPLISVVNGAQKAFGTRLDVTLPPQVTLVSVSASNAVCSGTSVLRCDFTDLDPGVTATVALNVRASSNGSYLSTLRLASSNDSNPANDSREVTVEITGANPAAASGGSAGGGGGRMEWLALVLLLTLILRRCVQMRAARKIPGGPTR